MDLDPEEFQDRLITAGIDVEGATPAELILLRPRIEAIVEQMKREQLQRTRETAEAAADQAEKISESVEDGASMEEAVSEVTAEAVSETLPESKIYGHQLFRDRSLEVYRATDNITPPDSYPLKPGDQLAVTIFGLSQTDFILTVDESGFVRLPVGTRIPISGIPVGEARRLLSNRLKRYYSFRDGELNIRIQAARTISINIFGEVENNGTFTLSSINTAFNALVAAGGPTERGSVRNIRLSDGDQSTRIDVYEYLQDPTQGSGTFLSNNAIIYVPLAENVVTIDGGIARPMQYELRSGETLADLIQFAGGTQARAETGNVRVTRYANGELQVYSIDLAADGDFVLQDEDAVVVPTVSDPLRNSIEVDGAVFVPGEFPFQEGITLGSVIRKARLRPIARRDLAFLYRTNDNGTQKLIRLNLGADVPAGSTNGLDLELKRGDIITVISESRFLDATTVEIDGAVRDTQRTIVYPDDGALTLEEAILLAGGLQANARGEAVIIRTPANNREERQYLRVDVGRADDVILQPRDRVLIYDRERFSEPFNVTIQGAVTSPGTYTFDPSLGLGELFTLAGGVRLSAARNKVDVFRLELRQNEPTRTLMATLEIDERYNIINSSVPDFQLQPYDVIAVRNIPNFQPIRTVVIQGEVTYPGAYPLTEANMRVTDMVAKAGGLSEEAFAEGATLERPTNRVGFVVIHLDEAMADPSVVSNVILAAGDTLNIPKRSNLVSIETRNTRVPRVYNDSLYQDSTVNIAYDGRHSAKWYINNYAAGFDKTAMRRSTTVELPNGEVRGTKRFLLFKNYPKVEPGSRILIGAKPEKTRRQNQGDEKKPIDWGKFARDTMAIATSALTLILLTSRLDD